MNMATTSHFKAETGPDKILTLTFDKADTATNTIDTDVLLELKAILLELKSKPPRALIFTSGKKNGFIAGANVTQFKDAKNIQAINDLVSEGQKVFMLLEELPFPTIALIDGFCLGGGFELALACKYRIASDSSKTKLGLPEILLGFHPGWGGTVRLPKLIGAPKAFDLILSGRTLSARSAKKFGIIDSLVPLRHLNRAANHYALNCPKQHVASKLERLTNIDIIRPLLGRVLYKQIAKKANPTHYPAPYSTVDNWVKCGCSTDAHSAEDASFRKLMVSSTAQNLLRIFFLRDDLKKLSKQEINIKNVHVIGAGVMGGDIAAWAALKGFNVTLQDDNEQAIAKSFKRARSLFTKKLKANHLVQQAEDRLIPDVDGFGVAKADLIIEAIVENKEVKQKLFRRILEQALPSAIIATNTSTIPLEEINENLPDKKRLVGIHYFNPVAKMMLVEVVKGKHTTDKVYKAALGFVGAIDKIPLPVTSSPGFLVNRILMPYLMESFILLEEGYSMEEIDAAALNFGMPMGPIELADTVGLDVCKFAGESLANYFAGSIPQTLANKVSIGELGRKTNKGFYSYKGNKIHKKKVVTGSHNIDEITDRLICRILNESVACLREKVVATTDHIDAGMIFGAGFAPFRGGPMNYTFTESKASIVDKLSNLATKHGDRFKPDAGWTELADAIGVGKVI